jgi:hypothetical protein
MIEIATGCDVPNAEIESPTGRAATEAALMICLLDNELLSRHKESVRSEYDAGLIRVLQDESPHVGLQDAVHTAIALRDRIMEIFLKLRDKLLAGSSPEMRTYVEALGHCIAGVTMFTATSPRYATNDSPADGPQFADTSTHKRWELPLPPQIAGWSRLAM